MTRLSPILTERLRSVLRDHRVEGAQDLVLSHAIEQLSLVRGKPEDYAAVGNGRLGGVPDLPPTISWPTTTDRDRPYQNFLLQVNLARCRGLSQSHLPATGMLYFFVGEVCTYNEIDARVIYYPGDESSLVRASPPPADSMSNEELCDLTPFQIHPHVELDFPSYGSDGYTQIETCLNTLDGTGKVFDRVHSALHSPLCVGKLLGYHSEYEMDERLTAYLVQSDQQDKSFAAVHYREQYSKLWSQVPNYRHLCSIYSNRHAHLQIEDYGHISYLIRIEHLLKRDFEHTFARIDSG